MSKVPNSERRSPRQRTLAQTLSELKQKQLVRAAVAYAVVAWLVIQVTATVAPAFGLPDWSLRAVVLAAIAGFVLTIVYFGLLHEPESGGILGSRKRFWRLLVTGLLLSGLIAAGTVIARRSGLIFTEKVSLAVLPFADLSPARDKAFFAEGVAEEILSTLAAEEGIKVLGRTSARQIERDADPKAIRASLGVTHLLEGSARAAGDQLRVNVRLIDTADGSQLWEEEYQGRLTDVFAVQDRIAGTVVQRLRGTFFKAAVRETRPTSVDAYQTYLAARALMRDPKKGPLTQAWRLARQIVDAHPDYALGHALYSEGTSLLADSPFTYGDIPADKARRIALAHARQAIRLAPDRAEGYASLGLASHPQQSIAPLQKAIALDRSWAALRGRLALALNGLGRHDEAFEQYRLAIETDPIASAIANRYIFALAADGKVDEALKAAKLFVERGGSEAQAWRFRGNALGRTGDESASLAARRRALALDPDLPYQHEWLAIGLHLLGLNEQAAQYSPRVSPYFRLFVADDRGALKAQVMRDGAKAWSANGIDSAIFSLARARDWPAIARFYDARPTDQRDLCATQPRFAPFVVMTLSATGRSGEASRLQSCIQRSLGAQLNMRHRSPDAYAGELEMWQASLLALRGDRRALDWLEKALARGWIGQYYSANLADWPQFDGLRGEPRYTEVQRRIDARVEKERAETLKMFGAAI
jgi:TolB-like protein/Tfp pilus assembly protein PilF